MVLHFSPAGLRRLRKSHGYRHTEPGGGGGGSYFPYILLNQIQTMFSQLAKRSARVLPADLVLIMRITSKSIDQRS